jgi:hypothetical protein
MLGANFFEAEAMGLHQDLVLSGNAYGNMTKDIVPMTFVRQNIARIS